MRGLTQWSNMRGLLALVLQIRMQFRVKRPVQKLSGAYNGKITSHLDRITPQSFDQFDDSGRIEQHLSISCIAFKSRAKPVPRCSHQCTRLQFLCSVLACCRRLDTYFLFLFFLLFSSFLYFNFTTHHSKPLLVSFITNFYYASCRTLCGCAVNLVQLLAKLELL